MRISTRVRIHFMLISTFIAVIATQSSTLTDNSIPFTINCRMTYAGHHYAGPQNVTKSGHECQSWAVSEPHYNYYVNSSHFPEVSSSVAGARCRNPEDSWHGGLWCYTTDPDVRWENCDRVPYCECKITESGYEYEGHISNTTSGRPCQSWGEQSPHPHPYSSLRFFPDYSMSTAGNHCRNPNNSRALGPWCYVNSDEGAEWEYCEITDCDWNRIEVYRRPTPTEATSPPLTVAKTTPTTRPLTRATRATTRAVTMATMTTRPVTRATTATKPVTRTTTRKPPPSANEDHLATSTVSRTSLEPSGLDQYESKMAIIKVVVPVVMVTSVAVVIGIVGIMICLKKVAASNSTPQATEGFDNPTYGQRAEDKREEGMVYSEIQVKMES